MTSARSTVKSRPSIVGAGLIALDVILTPDKPGKAQIQAGGTCGNVLAILSFLGWEAFPVARLNSDPAATHIRADLEQCGVHLELTHLAPTGETPIIVQKMRYDASGQPRHSFSWSCPTCEGAFPRYQAVHVSAVPRVLECVENPTVFFFDRVSRATINLAKAYAGKGALVVFEPSGFGELPLFAEALSVSHVVKYSHERIEDIPHSIVPTVPLLEIQTLGRAGLRFRMAHHSVGGQEWKHLEAYSTSRVVDTSGAGDWSTAGFLYALGKQSVEGLRNPSANTITAALRVGQELAAWNCHCLGARGGMYASYEEKGTSNYPASPLVHTRLNDLPMKSLHDHTEAFFPRVCSSCRQKASDPISPIGV